MSDKWTPEPRDKRLMAWVLRRFGRSAPDKMEADQLDREAAEAERADRSASAPVKKTDQLLADAHNFLLRQTGAKNVFDADRIIQGLLDLIDGLKSEIVPTAVPAADGSHKRDREASDSAPADDALYVLGENYRNGNKPVGFTLADVRDAQSAMRNAAKKLRGEGYHATADDLDHHANLLDGGAK